MLDLEVTLTAGKEARVAAFGRVNGWVYGRADGRANQYVLFFSDDWLRHYLHWPTLFVDWR